MRDDDNSEGRRYHVLEALGKGGFGTVYRAEMRSSGGFRKPVALKVLNPDVEGIGDIVNRLRDEARMLGMLRHRAIVQVDGLVFLDGRWTVVMEYVEGASLTQIIDSHGKIPPRAALAAAQEVAGALDAAFARPTRDGPPLGLLHRDIKPANIQITPMGEVKLLDFGVARANMEKREAKTQAVIFGSLPYMAPERFEMTDVHQSDIYALTATLLECITGAQLGRANLHPDKLRDQVDWELEKVRNIVDDGDLVDFIRAGLSYQWEERPDARAFERRAREIGERMDGPWLKDWSEGIVGGLLDQRSPENDELTGQMLHEGSTSGEQAASDLADLPEYPDETDDSIDFSGESPLPPEDDPTAAPEPPEKKFFPPGRGRRAPGALAILFRITLVVVALTVVAAVALPLMGMGGLALLCAPFWGDAVIETNRESFAEMLGDVVVLCADSPERNRVEVVLDRGIYEADRGTIGLIEIADFELLVEGAMQDGVITASEAMQIEYRYDKIVGD